VVLYLFIMAVFCFWFFADVWIEVDFWMSAVCKWPDHEAVKRLDLKNVYEAIRLPSFHGSCSAVAWRSSTCRCVLVDWRSKPGEKSTAGSFAWLTGDRWKVLEQLVVGSSNR
jgi:hypothetical protein